VLLPLIGEVPVDAREVGAADAGIENLNRTRSGLIVLSRFLTRQPQASTI